MHKAKIGDRVKLNERFEGYRNHHNKVPFKKGEIVFVYDESTNHIFVNRTGTKTRDDDYTLLNPIEYDMIEEEYKVGDIVISDKSNIYNSDYEGREGVIAEIDKTDYKYKYKVNFGKEKIWCSVKSLSETKLTGRYVQSGTRHLFGAECIEVGDILKVSSPDRLIHLHSGDEVSARTLGIRIAEGTITLLDENYVHVPSSEQTIYYEVSTTKEYNELLEYYKAKGEKVSSVGLGVTDNWKYVNKENGVWILTSRLPKGKKVDLPSIQTCFKKNEYIVITKCCYDLDSYKTNFCYKQRSNDRYLKSCCDNRGSATNGWDHIDSQKESKESDWRYATPEEIKEYERLGAPFNVTKIKENKKVSENYLNKDECIVLLNAPNNNDSNYPINHCYKLSHPIKKKGQRFSTYLDMKGDPNGWSGELRKATPEEAAYYEVIGKPYNINDLPSEKIIVYEGIDYAMWNPCKSEEVRSPDKVKISVELKEENTSNAIDTTVKRVPIMRGELKEPSEFIYF